MATFLDSPEDNIVEELVDPHFSTCTTYRRLTAFFRPSVLKVWKNSLSHIINTENIKIQIMIAGTHEDNLKLLVELNKYDSDIDKSAILDKKADEILEEVAGLNEKGTWLRQRNILAWLIKEKKLEFKLSFVTHEDQLELDHRKSGYFEKPSGQKIVFAGSVNESDSAYVRHGEELTIWDSHNENDIDYATRYAKKLDRLWKEEPSDFYKIRKPSPSFLEKVAHACTIKDKFHANKELEILLKEYEEDEAKEFKEDKAEKPRSLATHQTNALKKWKSNNFQGILEHATGSGKTFTSLNAIKKISEAKKNLMVVVGVPFTFLADQWSDELNGFFKNHDSFNKVVECYDSSKKWWESARKELILLKQKMIQDEPHLSIIVTVNNTMASDNFANLIKESGISSDDIFVIGDECHRYTSKTYLNALPQARFRLGLSATPIIDHNNLTEGEEGLLNYFGDICDVYTLKMGIENDWLCKYEYYPHECYLKPDEFNRWKELLDQGNINLNDYQDDIDSAKDTAINKMLDVIDSSEEKYQAFNKLISSIENPEYSLVFCSERKIDNTKDIDAVCTHLDEKNWRYSRITFEVKRHERNQIINSFVRGDRQCIVAIKVLDEGVDIPTIKTAIILASSKNRRQFVQRRGRVLRKSKGKDKAIIHDFIVLPPPSSSLDGNQLVELELKRVAEMSECAENKIEVENFIENIRNNFNYGLKD